MTNNNYGLKEWSDISIRKGGKQNQSRRDQFLRLSEGDNCVRFITKAYQYQVYHYKTNEDDKGFGERVMVPMDNDPFAPGGPLASRGLKPQTRWLTGVIDRKTQSYKILDISSSISNSLRDLAQNEKWGDPIQYDVTIVVDKNGGPTGYYRVMPDPKTPLTAADLELKAQIDVEDFMRRITPPTAAQVMERIKFIDEKNTKKPGTAASTEEEDDSTDFPVATGSDA
jgi:hypothetical protein